MGFLLLLLFILEVHSLNISHVIEVYTSACGSKLCDRSKQPDVIKKLDIYECPPCYCDKQCFSKMNCCPDFYFSYQLKCTNTKIVEKSPYKDSTSVLMVDTCPSFADNKTKYLCEKKNDDLIDQIQNLPVTDSRNNLIFRNMYCALCHNETKENIRKWQLEIQCLDFADFNFLSSYEEIFNTADDKRCNIGFHTDISTHDIPVCNSAAETRVQKCNITGTWTKYDSDVEKACETYNQKSYPLFKNVFCFICNPPRNQDDVISQCNITGLWQHYDSNLEHACKMAMSSTIILPFRNIYCYRCNKGRVNYLNNVRHIDQHMNKDFRFEFSLEFFESTFTSHVIHVESGNYGDIYPQIDANNTENSKKININREVNVTNLARYLMAFTGSINEVCTDKKRACDCSDDCHFHPNGCCIDKVFQKQTICSDEIVLNRRTGFQLYASCSEETNRNLSDLCHRNSSIKNLEFLPIAVTSRETGSTHYKNRYCAICSHKNAQFQFQSWDLILSCDTYIPINSLKTVLTTSDLVKNRVHDRLLITTPRPTQGSLPSFRVLFTLQLPRYENKLDSSNGSSCEDVFIQETGECRSLKCYPGRILMNDVCIPLLPTSTNLGYILAIGMKGLLTETINSTRLFLQSIDKFFQMHLYKNLELKMSSSTKSSLLLTDLSCDTGTKWENGTEIILFGQLTIFISEYVNRSLIEISLLQNLNTKFNVTHEGATYTFHTYPVSEAFNTYSLIRKSGFTNKCFRKQTYAKRYREASPDLFVHSQVTNLLICNQVELQSSEFETDRFSMNLTFLKNGLQLTQDQYILTPFKTARVCLDTFEKLMSIRSAPKEQIDFWRIILRICTFVSLVCLLVTYLTYCFFPTLRTVPGKNNMCLIFAMFWAHTILQFGVFETELQILCKMIGILLHYFWLVTFGCFNICSYHMYKVFTYKTFISSNEKSNIKLYIVYSYGIPAIIVCLNIVIIRFIANDRDVGYGGMICFISQPISIIVTFVVPVTLVCVSNILFFVITSVKIATRPKFRTEHSTKIDRVYFTVYLKLFSITGISWILQIIDSFLMTSTFSLIVSVLNALQGVFIFISFTCNNRVLALYKTICGKSSPQ
ncbi:unnamed protein product [Mytilus coruscus]|uniref:G-protein coupled receptors family 2 profile 2 domain-containing protein n=1 Tax=Mytilus coruscus TaxID=42192 RepID=A0A6J8DJ05_MYTCO|nr:unnamed protein product [Mytilus coruscus]